MKTYLGIVFVLTSFGLAQPNGVGSAREVARAENNFSSASVKHGIKPAFLEFLSDDCVMFNPHPVNGKELYKDRPASSAQLSWFPTFVEAAASGEIGISTGPWEYRKAKGDTPVAYGHFFSIWKKQPDGTWKVALDVGVDYPKEKRITEKEHIKTLGISAGKKWNGETAGDELSVAESNFIRTVHKTGAENAYSQFAAENIRVYRKGNFPTQQKSEALRVLKNHQLQKGFSPVVTQVAMSGDLGYTYGFCVDAENDSSSYVRVWRKEKEWKIAVDILGPFN